MRIDQLVTIAAMPVRPAVKQVLTRLGIYGEGQEEISRQAQQALRGLMPRGCMKLVPLVCEAQGIRLGERFIGSRTLSEWMAGCRFGLIMLSSFPQSTADRVEEAFTQNQTQDAVVLDAALSVAADGGLDYLMKDAARRLRPQGLSVQPRRFSPGYADCALENQQVLLELLEHPFGVQLTESFMLVPQKTVMAIGGVKDEIIF